MVLGAKPPRRPVLVTAFNRPEPLARVLEAVSAAQPPRVYVALDAPRRGNPEDDRRCLAVLRLVELLASRLDTKILRQSENQGCRRAMTAALDWFFEQEPAGIVLEDDCLPSPQFFPYCETLLDRYSSDSRVWMITGCNLVGTYGKAFGDYFFSDGGVWGWASWREFWTQRDTDMKTWADAERRRAARRFLGKREWRRVRTSFETVARGELDTWDYQWLFLRASHGGLAAVPTANLVENIGFGADATHTTSHAKTANISIGEITLPPTSSAEMTADRHYMALRARRERTSLPQRAMFKVSSLFRRYRGARVQ